MNQTTKILYSAFNMNQITTNKERFVNEWWSQKLTIFLLIMLIVCGFLYATIDFNNFIIGIQIIPKTVNSSDLIIDNNNENDENYNSTAVKYILFWTEMFREKNWYLSQNVSGEEYFKRFNCPTTSCILTSDPLLLPDIQMFDALLFHGAESWIYEFIKPSLRSSHQFYVMSILESPYHIHHQLNLDAGIFNWTMTYRLDSDVLWTYGHFTDKATNKIVAPAINPPWKYAEIDSDHDENLSKIFDRKTKMAAWFVSNCNTESNRGKLVAELAKYFPIDIYGKCGPLKCPREQQDVCKLKLENEYKFYFSFENSLCIDYVTEKIFGIMKYHVIPVVYGGANYSNFLPPHSYINANDFPTAKKLAEFLLNLSKQPEEYIKYFWWKKYYTVDDEMNFCNLCKKLHKTETAFTTKTYNNIDEWWRNKTCTKKSSILF